MFRPFSWLGNTLYKRGRRRAPLKTRSKRTLPRVELLEDRLAPATLYFQGMTNNWNDTTNWTGGALPSAVDDVVFTNPMMKAHTTLNVNTFGIQIRELRLEAGFTLNIASELNAVTFRLTGGVVNGAGTFYVSQLLDWTGGTMAGAGITSILANATANVALTATSGIAQPLGDTRIFDNNGITNWTGPLNISTSAMIQNDKTFNFNGTNLTFNTATPIQNTDTVTFNQSNITFNGPLTLGSHLRVLNTTSQLVTINGNVTLQNFTLSSDLTGSGTLTVNNTLSWLSGKMSGAGATIVAATGTLDLASTLTRTLDGRTLTVYGQRVSATSTAGTTPPPGSPPPPAGGGSGATVYASIGVTTPTGMANPDLPFDNKNARPMVPPGPLAFNAVDAAGALYAAMFGGTFSLNTTEETIFKILESYDEPQLFQISAAYSAHYRTAGNASRNLRDDLASQLSEIPDQALRATAMMDGNRALADAAAIHYAIYPSIYDAWQKDLETLFRVLGRYVNGPLGDLHLNYMTRYSTSLPTDLDARLSGDDLTHARYLADLFLADSLRQRGLVYMDAVALDAALQSAAWNNRSETVVQILARNSTRLSVLLDVYATCFRGSNPANQNIDGSTLLYNTMAAKGWTTAEQSYVGQAITGNRITLLAAKLNDAMDRWGTDEDAVWNTLDGLYADERAMVAQTYVQLYNKTLSNHIYSEFEDSATFGPELTKTIKFLRHGGFSVAERFYFAVQGVGTDMVAIHRAVGDLEGLDIAQVNAVRNEYLTLSGNQSLDNALWWDISGRDWLYAQQALRGRATTLREEVDRLLERVDFDRPTGVGLTWGDLSNVVNSTLQSLFNQHGTNVDRSHTDLINVINAFENNQATEGQVRAQMALVRQDLDAYTEARDSGADFFANALTTAAAVGIGIFSGGSATPVAILLYATVGAATNTITRIVLQGQTYDLGNLTSDLAVGGFSTATAPFTLLRLGQSQSFVTNVLRGAVEGGVNGGSLGFLQGAFSTAARQTTWANGYELGLVQVLNAGASSAVVGLPTGALIGGVMRAMQAPRAMLANVRAGVYGAKGISNALVGATRETGQPFTAAALIQQLRAATQTPATTALLAAIDNGTIQVVMDVTLTTRGSCPAANMIKVHPMLKDLQTAVGVLLHEGQHALDIGAGIVPLPGSASPAELLRAEARAWASEMQFLEVNSYTSSINYQYIALDPREFLYYVEIAYNLRQANISDAECLQIINHHMRQFVYGGHSFAYP